MMQSRLSLSEVEWDKFFIGGVNGVFEVSSTKSGIDKNKLNTEIGDVPYITRSDIQNGINSFITDNQSSMYSKNKGNVITIGLDTQTVFYQNNDFFTGQNIQILKNDYINKSVAMFIIPLLKIQMRKFNWGGNGATLSRLKRTKILLPVDNSGNPNWQFMEDYIKQEEKDIAQKVISYYEQKMLEASFDLVGLEGVEWKEFNFSDVFRKIQRGKRLKKDDHICGNNPYVSSTSLSNGIDQFIGNEENIRKFKNNLTVANSGSVGSCFYHEYEYIASDHVTSLTLNKTDKYVYLFMATIIKRLEEKYSFNREINDKRIRNEKFILPVDKNGNPHWEYMSQFMRRLEKEKIQKMLTYIYRLTVACESTFSPLNEKEWKAFWLEDIVTIESGVRLTKANQEDGNIAFIGATDNNNGITNFIKNRNSSLDSNVLGVNYNGSVVENFYHPYEAVFSDDVKRLHWKDKEKGNKYTYLFLKQAILKQKEKYAYGYKFNASRMNRQKILLPVNKSGNVDFDYMKKYMQIEEIKQSYKIIEHFKRTIQ
ncbi:MAG: restriction endonuclease subunit S [Negativicoccus succinicivorans]|uniref:restriction endonuclease subunit S n=1 Tax=Negativicoccus succinicivorans TaxID=620903 RepID=UPI0026EE880A|nr:restriction endonuclease subunit S [Negativicoccus succinicivorans]MBS5887738.1 restriction endonuclease subunit S [Negativicoccus succinicivorans]